MFVTLVDEKAGTEFPALLVEVTHDGERGTLLVLNSSDRTVTFVPRIPNGADNAYVDDDGKHGQFFRSGDPTDFPDNSEETAPPENGPDPDAEDTDEDTVSPEVRF
jgi:hypothetical protein